MLIQIFNISMLDDGSSLAEMNRFLSGHKVLNIEQRFFQNDQHGGWSFCVRYLPAAQGFQPGSRDKVDYRQVLGDKEFSVYTRLREIRKQISTSEAIPAYAVFTDEELAGIARLPVLEESALMKIQGIGEKKVAKYGKQVIEMLGLNNAD